jgi:tetratricopeptide (TPR) repeat protein
LKSDAAPAWGILGLCEFEVAEYAASLAHIQRTIESGASLERGMEKVLRFHESMLLTRAGDYDHAIQKYTWFLRGPAPTGVLLTALGLAALRTPRLPRDVAADEQELFDAAGRTAFAQMAGDRAGAERGFEALLARYPTAHHVHYLHGCSLLAANPDRAIEEFRREIEITPASSGALAMLSWALLNRGDSAAALPYAQRAAKSDPAYPLAQYVLGRALVETGNVRAGIEHLEAAAEKDPANVENHIALAAAYPKAGRYQDARRERQKSLELTREDGRVAQP